MEYFLIGFLCWVIFNWVASLSVLVGAEKLSRGRLPYGLMGSKEASETRYYLAHLPSGYGFSIWAPPLHIIVFDKAFFQKASADAVHFVIAHELGHRKLGHHWKRWLLVISGLILLPAARRWLKQTELEADMYAEHRTGLTWDRIKHRAKMASTP